MKTELSAAQLAALEQRLNDLNSERARLIKLRNAAGEQEEQKKNNAYVGKCFEIINPSYTGTHLYMRIDKWKAFSSPIGLRLIYFPNRSVELDIDMSQVIDKNELREISNKAFNRILARVIARLERKM